MRNLPFAHDPRPLEVLYEDSDLIVVNKPPGYHTAPVHRWQTGSMVNLLLSHLAAQGQANAKPYVLHRLDQYTSGVLLFAKRREVVPGIAQQFR
jgi:23S rRNA pseudouridine1911/1915/1917 synthase